MQTESIDEKNDDAIVVKVEVKKENPIKRVKTEGAAAAGSDMAEVNAKLDAIRAWRREADSQKSYAQLEILLRLARPPIALEDLPARCGLRRVVDEKEGVLWVSDDGDSPGRSTTVATKKEGGGSSACVIS